MNVAYGTFGQMTAYNPPAGGGSAQADECSKATGKVDKWQSKLNKRSTQHRKNRLAYWSGKQRVYCEQYEADIASQRAETALVDSFMTDDTAGIVYPDAGTDPETGEALPGGAQEDESNPLLLPIAALVGIGALGLIALLVFRR